MENEILGLDVVNHARGTKFVNGGPKPADMISSQVVAKLSIGSRSRSEGKQY